MRHLRRLRPARVRYRLAESFGAERRRARRWRPWRILAARPSPPPGPPVVSADDLPRIHVVEYVLPALAPAEPAPVAQAGLNL